MKNFFLLFFLVIFSTQDFSAYNKLARINVDNDFFTTDPLGNVYLIKNNIISKYDNEGNFKNSYSNSISGNVSIADVSDPLRIMLFYSDFNQIIFLDKTLSLLGDPINLDEFGIDQTGYVCSSPNDGFWIYDKQREAILYFDKDLEIRQQTTKISNLVDYETEPGFIIVKNNMVFLLIPGTGILIFDNFGSYFKTLNIKDINSFQVFENQIVFYKNQQLLFYNYIINESNEINLPVISNLRNVRLENKNIYLGTPESCIIFRKN